VCCEPIPAWIEFFWIPGRDASVDQGAQADKLDRAPVPSLVLTAKEAVLRDKIIAAIEGRRLIAFTYDGIAREAQPCAVGISTAGNNVMRCYQVRGGHVTPGHEWDLCDLSKIRNLVVTEDVFHGEPPGYRRGDRGMTQIFAQL
jgi:hypothetical protein